MGIKDDIKFSDALKKQLDGYQPANFYSSAEEKAEKERLENEQSKKEAASHALFSSSKKLSNVVEEISETVCEWNGMTIETKQSEMLPVHPQHPNQNYFTQHLLATKESGDSLEVQVTASSFFSENHNHKRDLNVNGLKAEAQWTIKAVLDGKEYEFQDKRATDPNSRSNSAIGILDSDPRITMYFLKPFKQDIVAVKQMFASFDKLENYLKKKAAEEAQNQRIKEQLEKEQSQTTDQL